MYSDIPEGFEPVDTQPSAGTRALATTFGYRDPEDNGVGAWGDRTNNPDILGVSLPPSVLRDHFGNANAARGALVEVTNPITGKSLIAPIVDKGPADWVIHRQGNTIDLTHAANRAIGGSGKTPVQYNILGHPNDAGMPPGYQLADDAGEQPGGGSFSDLPPGFVPLEAEPKGRKADDLVQATPQMADQLGLSAWRDNTDNTVVARAQPVEVQQYKLPPKVRGPFEAFGEEFMGATAKGAINSVAGVARALSKADETTDEAATRFDNQIADQQAAIDGLKAAIAKRGFASAEDDAALARMGQELKNLQITKDLTLNTDQFGPEAQTALAQRREAAKADADFLAKNAQQSAEYWGADPRDQSTAAGIGRGLGNVTAMAPTMVVPLVGLPAAALQGASMAYEEAYTATADQMHQAGVTDPKTIEDAAHQAASASASHTLPALAAYMVGGKLTSDAVGALFKASSPLVKGIAGGAAAAGSNMLASGAMRAASGEDWRPNAESMAQDVAFGAIHGLGTAQQARVDAAQRGQPDRPNDLNEPINVGPKAPEPPSAEPTRPASVPEEDPKAETPPTADRNEWTTATEEDGFIGRPDEEFEREKAQEETSKPEEPAPLQEEAKAPATGIEAALREEERPPIEQAVRAQDVPLQTEPDKPRTFSTRPPADGFGSELTPTAAHIIDDLGGLMSKKTAKQRGIYDDNKELWDDAPGLSHPTHNKIYNAKGVTPDIAAGSLGLSVPEMWAKIKKESDSARNIADQEREQNAKVEAQAKLDKNFKRDVIDPKAKAKKPTIQTKDLQPGDTVQVGKESLKVVDIDPETFDVTLQDGKKYGVQHVADGEVIYGEHKPAKPEKATAGTPTLAASIKKRMAAKKEAAFIDTDFLNDLHDYGRSIYRKGMDYLDWSMRMVKDLGAGIKGMLRKVWDAIQGAHLLPHAREIGAITAYHGTPHEVDRFRMDKIGTGEGAQAYGHGLYFAENEKVAGGYRAALSDLPFPDGDPRNGAWTLLNARGENEARKFLNGKLSGPEFEKAIKDIKAANAGNIYSVRLDAKPDEFIDWDKPLSEQSEKVKSAIASMNSRFFEAAEKVAGGERARDVALNYGMNALDLHVANGGALYSQLSRELGGEKQASASLAASGIKGIRYLDNGSRVTPAELDAARRLVSELEEQNKPFTPESSFELRKARLKLEGLEKKAQQQTRNFVIFDENAIKITHKNGQEVSLPEFGASIRDRLAKQEGGFIDASIVEDVAAYGRQMLGYAKDFASWSKLMVQRLGAKVSSVLRKVWDTINGGRLPHAKESGAVGSTPNATAAQLAKKRRGIAAELAGYAKDKAKEFSTFVHDLPEFGDFKRSLLTWNAKNQKSSNEIERIHREIGKQVPDPIRREAITNWIQAEGNVPTLLSRAAASKSAKVRKGYEAAARLTPAEIAIANRIRQSFDILQKRAEKNGIEIPYRKNYVPEIWKEDPELPPGTSSRRLSEQFKFAKERVFKDYFEGEQAGFEPETKDIANLLALYMNDMNNAINSRQFVAELSKAKASDGRPILALRGGGKRVETERGKSHLVFPDRPEEEARDYKVIDQPALHDWRVVGKSEDGAKIMVMGDLSVHPDVAKHLARVLGQSALREWWSTKTDNPFLNAGKKIAKVVLDDVQSIAKGTMLSFSPFHQVQEGVHAIGHRINPFSHIPKIDMRDPAQLDAARHGLMLAHDRTSQALFMEGVGENSRNLVTMAARKFGKAGRAFADLFDGYQHWLFGQYIPGLKFKTYQHILDRNMARYAKELKAGTATAAQVKNLSARQSNAAYGHLNYVEMGHSPTIRHAMQVALLAPDFLEARARFVGQALKSPFSRTGSEQWQALAFLAITQFIAARIGNKLSTDDYGWDHPFELRVGNKWYGFRSVPEDLFKMAHAPQEFIGGRISPIFGKFVQEGLFHTNYRNERTSMGDAVTDILTGMIPLPVQALTRDLTAQSKANPVSPFEQILGATGIRVSRYSPLTEIYKQAHDWTDKNFPNESSKAVYPVSRYTQLRYALEDGDREAARAEVRKLQKTGATLAAIAHGFEQSVSRPFAGSEKKDEQFYRDLDARGRMAFKAAKKRQDIILNRFTQYIGPKVGN